jgi:hypothetical protein
MLVETEGTTKLTIKHTPEKVSSTYIPKIHLNFNLYLLF